MVWQCLNINTARRLPAASSSLKIDEFSDTHSTHCRVKLFASTNRHQTLLKNIQIRRHFFILLHMPNLLLPILKHQNITQQSPPFIQYHQSIIPNSAHRTSSLPFQKTIIPLPALLITLHISTPPSSQTLPNPLPPSHPVHAAHATMAHHPRPTVSARSISADL